MFRNFVLFIQVLVLLILPCACSRSKEAKARSDRGLDELTDLTKILAEMPAARHFEFHDLDTGDQYYLSARLPSQDRALTDSELEELHYGYLSGLLKLPRKTEKELREIFPPNQRGFLATSYEFKPYDEEFLIIHHPKSFNIAKLKSLLERIGFRPNIQDSVQIWSGKNESNNNVELAIRDHRIYVASSIKLLTQPVIPTDQTMLAQPQVQEFIRLLLPHPMVLYIDIPSNGSTLFGSTDEAFAMERSGLFLHEQIISLYQSEKFAQEAYAFHASGSRKPSATKKTKQGTYIPGSQEQKLIGSAVVHEWVSRFQDQ